MSSSKKGLGGLSIDDLPSPDTKRWVPSRKAIVIYAVRGGLMPLKAVLSRYHMTE